MINTSGFRPARREINPYECELFSGNISSFNPSAPQYTSQFWYVNTRLLNAGASGNLSLNQTPKLHPVPSPLLVSLHSAVLTHRAQLNQTRCLPQKCQQQSRSQPPARNTPRTEPQPKRQEGAQTIRSHHSRTSPVSPTPAPRGSLIYIPRFPSCPLLPFPFPPPSFPPSHHAFRILLTKYRFRLY